VAQVSIYLQNFKTKTPKANKLDFGFSIIGFLSDLQQRVLLPIFPNSRGARHSLFRLNLKRTSAPFMQKQK
jgi:hypothetical protein